MKRKVLFSDLGENRPYKQVWDYQQQLLDENINIKSRLRNSPDPTSGLSTTDYLLFVEHSPVYTLGKSGDISNVLISEDEQKSRGIDFFRINRGGDITFHGPEQLVGYPILDLEKYRTDIGWYLRSLEEVVILTLSEYGLKGDRSAGETGVWLDPHIKGKERKVCAMGIRCSRWITMHGFALNVNPDLSYFDYIVPCEIRNKKVTSLEKELNFKLNLQEVKQKLLLNFEKVFNVEILSGFNLSHGVLSRQG